MFVDVILDRNYETSYVPAFQTTYICDNGDFPYTPIVITKSHLLGPIRVRWLLPLYVTFIIEPVKTELYAQVFTGLYCYIDSVCLCILQY